MLWTVVAEKSAYCQHMEHTPNVLGICALQLVLEDCKAMNLRAAGRTQCAFITPYMRPTICLAVSWDRSLVTPPLSYLTPTHFTRARETQSLSPHCVQGYDQCAS